MSGLCGQRTLDAAAPSTTVAMASSEGRLKERSPCSTAVAGDACIVQDVDESSDMGESGMCRICFEGFRAGNLLSPCNCRGTIGLVHRECLEEWLSRKNTDECSICSYRFKVVRTPRSIPDLLRDPSSRPNLWNILARMLESLKRAIQLTMILWLSAVKIISYISSEPGFLLIGSTVVLAAAIYVPIIYLTERRYYLAFIQWRQSTSCVRLLHPNSVFEGTGSVHPSGLPQCPQLPSESPTPMPPTSSNMTATNSNAGMTTSIAAGEQD